MFSPHLVILFSAMSLGGMASVGYSHHRNVDTEIAQRRAAEREESSSEIVVAELSGHVEESISKLEQALEGQREIEKAEIDGLLSDVVSKLRSVEQWQSSHEVLISQLDKEQTRMEFKLETHDKSFRPLRGIGGSRFQPVSNGEEVHSLLPALDPDWGEQF